MGAGWQSPQGLLANGGGYNEVEKSPKASKHNTPTVILTPPVQGDPAQSVREGTSTPD